MFQVFMVSLLVHLRLLMSEDQVADMVNYFISDSAAAITGEAFSIH